MSEFYLRVLGAKNAGALDAMEVFGRTVSGRLGQSPAEDLALVEALIEARGHEVVLTEPGAHFIVAGAIDTYGSRKGVGVVVTSKGLVGGSTVLAETTTNDDGEFSVLIEGSERPIFRVAFSRDSDVLHTTPPRRAAAENWVEWRESSVADTGVARPGFFELREALLDHALNGADKELYELEETTENPEITTLAETVGLAPSYVMAHAITSRVVRALTDLSGKGLPSLDLSRAVVFSVAGSALSPVDRSKLPRCCDRRMVPRPTENLSEDFMLALKQAIDNEEVVQFSVERMVDVILETPTETLKSSVESAVEQGVISCETSRGFNSTSAGGHRATRREVALSRKPGGFSTWSELFAEIGAALSGVRSALADVLLTRSVVDDALFDRLSDVIDKYVSGGTARLRLAGFVDFSATELAALDGHGISDGSQLASLSQLDLEEMLADVLAGRPDMEEARVRVLGRLDKAYVGAGMLRRDLDITADTRTFVSSGNLLSLNIEKKYREEEVPGSDPVVVREQALKLQRVARLAQDGALAAKVYSSGYTSATQIALTSPQKLQLDLTAAGVSAAEVQHVRRRARAHHQATMSVYMRYNRGAAGPATRLIKGRASELLDEDIAGAPSWEVLFGNADYCDCEHCCSVTSPAAYLVDSLQWMQRADASPTPYDAFVAKRPDIPKILLNCANSETLVPYIDLVNELLEDEVQVRSGSMTRPDVVTRTATRQTTLSAAEIRAYPEFIDREAYVVLESYGDRFVKPFSLPAHEMRLYLASQLTSRDELIRLLNHDPDRRALAQEKLFASPTEWSLITTVSEDAETSQWGFEGLAGEGPWKLPLDQFLRAAPSQVGSGHLSYDELTRLLACREWVNPAGAVYIELADDVDVDLCRGDQRLVSGVTSAALDRMHRFLRLARAMPHSFAEIDLLLRVLQESDLEWQVSHVVDALERAKQLNLGAEEVAFFLTDFRLGDVAPGARFDGRPTLYARTFLFRDGDGQVPEAFLDPEGTAATFEDAQSHLVGALGVEGETLEQLMEIYDINPSDPIRLAPLSTLYRAARFINALDVSVEHLAILLTITSPFESTLTLGMIVDYFVPIIKRYSAESLSISWGLSDARMPAVQELTDAVDALKNSAQAQLQQQLDEGAPPPSAPDIKAYIGATASWTGPVLRWVGLDTRYSPLLLALNQSMTGALFEALFDLPGSESELQILCRMPNLIDSLDLDVKYADDWRFMPRVMSALSAASSEDWTLARWYRDLCGLAKSPTRFFEFLRLLDTDESPSATLEQIRDAFAAAFEIDTVLLEDAWNVKDVDQESLLFAQTSLQVLRIVGIAMRLGVSASTLDDWNSGWPSADEAVSVRNAVRARLRREEWQDVSTKVQDMLREYRRDALVRYLLGTAGENDPRTVTDLYGRHLIDPEMDDCMDTSRIVQANAAIQLFVQRCFLGLEAVTAASPDDDHWAEWEWRKNYRVWEANRKVFLYPENFLNVAKRDTASPEFATFMKEVREGNAESEAVNDAFKHYLENLETISNLDYLAIASNALEGDAFEKQLHVVARTRTAPHKYFHRLMANGVWTPWGRLDIGSSGANFSMVHHEGKTTLLWPTFTDQQDSTQPIPGVPESPDEEAQSAARAITYLTYNWTTHSHRKWSTTTSGVRPLLHQKRARNRFSMLASPVGGGLRLEIFAPLPPHLEADSVTAFNGELPVLGDAVVRRDMVDIVVEDNRVGFASAPGGEHRHYWDEMGRFGPGEGGVTYDRSRIPWADFRYEDGRLRSEFGASGVTVRGSPDGVSIVHYPILAGGSRFYLAITGQSGFFDSVGENYARIRIFPGMELFSATDNSRSFLVLSEGVRTALGLLSSSSFTLSPGHHAFASDFIDVLRRFDDGLKHLLTPTVQESPQVAVGRPLVSYVDTYGPSQLASFEKSHESLDFELTAPYANYNWELFLFGPLVVADQLRSAGRFADASRFYEYVLRPFTNETVDPANELKRYWVFKPFRDVSEAAEDIDELLANGVVNGANLFELIERDPFDPHAVALRRPSAYQKHVFMRYLDNLMAWGDSLYRQGTRESVYEAIQYYLLVQQLLGERPEKMKPLGLRTDHSFESVEWAPGANALVDLENLIFDASAIGKPSSMVAYFPAVTMDNGRKLYFCIPPNDKLLKYWDDVERRLHNIRHCLTIDGVPVRYDLLAAPIDPQSLVDATAAGVSIAQALADGNRPLPPYRFSTLWAKAREACAEVKSLGSALLSALEKRDGEQLANLRSAWEGKLLERSRRTRELNREQAQSEVESLLEARKTIQQRKQYYDSREFMTDIESAALVLSGLGSAELHQAAEFSLLSSFMHLVPNFSVGINGVGGSPNATMSMGGDAIGSIFSMIAQVHTNQATQLDRSSSAVATLGGYHRRLEEWTQQSTQSQLELNHIDKQIAAAKLRVAIADAEIKGHEVQEKSWKATDELLAAKFTNQERYEHHVSMLSDVYRTAYEHALSMTKMAWQCLDFELPPLVQRPALVGTAYWDGLQQGLLAGEQLAGDLHEMERVHVMTRPFARAITQHLPLSIVDPFALLRLRTHGSCDFSIPAWWFKRFDPTLKNRRIKSVAVSVPSVTGPYTGMNATLRFDSSTWSKTRKAISLSNGVNDSGGATQPDTYAAFEGVGLDADTAWSFGFPTDEDDNVVTDVDFSTITDVIVHFEYYAEEGGDQDLSVVPTPAALIDLRAMAPEAWNELRFGAEHSVTIKLGDLLPTAVKHLLGDGAFSDVLGTLALTNGGEDVSAGLDFDLVGDELTIEVLGAGPGVPAIDWEALRLVLVAVGEDD